MTTVAQMQATDGTIMAARYGAAFSHYCRTGEEDALMTAYDLAREALGAKMTLAAFGTLHHAAMRQYLSASRTAALDIDRAEDFYLEGVAVFDMAIQGYQINVASLKNEVAERRRVEEELRDVTFELARQRDDLDRMVQQRTTELQKRAEELELTNRQLKHTNREQADFTYALSHDLKTPINTIDMFLQTLLEEFDAQMDAEALELVSIASQTAERMKQLIDDVLSYSRVVEHEFRNEAVDLNVIVRQIAQDAAANIRAAGAEVRCEDLPPVKGSGFQLGMLLSNFLSNALKYRATDRPPVVRIWGARDAATGQVRICVSDNGIGMAEGTQDRIFSLFKRLHRFDEIKGSGVGLALCKRVAENHGTAIDVASELGRGTTFSLLLAPGDVP